MASNPFGATCAGPQSNLITFNQCTSNALYSSDGIKHTGVEDLCQDKLSISQAAYYDCLCTGSKAILVCFANTCSDSPASSAIQNSQVSYCQSAAANPLPTLRAPVTTSSMAAGPVLSLPGTSSGAQSGMTVATVSGGSASAGASGVPSNGSNGAAANSKSSSSTVSRALALGMALVSFAVLA
ncbi:hypothetical protein CcCBS67573_g00202 [Chytriomyces confervae]|uniref:Uncharacterized protein n=1 Tax=Chytriomyces confervae TaxID=246404 RepID=A0A507FPX1_9FUNG|nr:hypothetical protein HDU80_002412 [Chytriomyces hyalinus]TPX78471.1 hypothetical protein CcCBS67573_g00202 [Chytriomyces confervae]